MEMRADGLHCIQLAEEATTWEYDSHGKLKPTCQTLQFPFSDDLAMKTTNVLTEVL